MVTYNEALEESLKYFGGDELAAKAYVDKYALKTPEDDVLEPNPSCMHKRLAKEFARIEAKYPNPMGEEEIYNLFDRFRYIIPQGSPMSAIGNPYQIQSLSNCFVIELGDSYGWIGKADQELAHIYRRRGGAGLDISALRPISSKTKNAAGSSTGIGPFMERFSRTTREVGQCIAEDQRVLTEHGLVEIKNVKPNDKVWTKTGWVKVLDVVSNGIKEVFETTSEFGFQIQTTLNHVFVNGQGQEQALEEFEAGDSICILPGTKLKRYEAKLTNNSIEYTQYGTRTNYDVTMPKTLNKQLAYLLGYSYGDGYVEMSKLGYPVALSLACSNDYPEIKKTLNNVCEELFSKTLTLRKGDGDLEVLTLSSVILMQFLKENDLLKQKSFDIKIPSKIWESPTDVQIAFISGYFDADGYASGKKKGYVLSSISKSFLRDIQTILLSNGIVSKIHTEEREDKGWHTLYNLCIVGKSSQENFVSLATDSVKVGKSQHISKRDCIITPYTASTFDIKYGNYSYIEKKQNLSVSAYRRYIKESERFDLPEVLVKDTIRGITSFGMKETYDLVLETEHLFWCEGFYVHNSGRRGANMQTISIHHPEIKTFLNIKKDLKKVTGSNISVKITHEFMNALLNGTSYQQRWPVDSKNPKICNEVSAKEIWDEIVENAWESAEPGVLFWDTILEQSPADAYHKEGFRTVSTNPCAELPLAVGDACRLIVLNLMGCVIDPFSKNAKFDWAKLKEISYKGQRLMDDLVDLEIESIDTILAKIESDPEPEEVKTIEKNLWLRIKKKCEDGRRTGLGPTAVGDALAALGVTYGSEDSIRIVEHFYRTIALASYEASIDMAKERGPFPIFNFESEKDQLFLNKLWESEPLLFKKYLENGRRNIANLTTAPCGTVSLLAEVAPGIHQTTSGIECVFLPFFVRRKKINQSDKEAKVDFIDDLGDKWQEFTVFHSGFKLWMEKNGKTKEDFEQSPYYKATSMDLDWVSGVKLQAAAQKWVDHSISRTQNLPSDVSKETVSEIYKTAYTLGCKGFTIYRDGCRSGVLVAESSNKKNTPHIVEHDAPKRPIELECDVYHNTIGGEKWVIFVSLLEGKPYELMGGLSNHINLPKRVKKGKIVKMSNSSGASRYNFHYDYQNAEDEVVIRDIGNIFQNETNSAFSRVLSLSLRHGTPVQYVVEQLIKGSDKESDLFSYSKGMSRVLKNYIKDGTKTSQKKCDVCESTKLAFQQGCVTCLNCGKSKCS